MATNTSRSCQSASGFSLTEALVAMGIVTTAVVSLAQLFAVSTRSNIASRNTTFAAVLAAQKMEELRALTWCFDASGLPLTDTSTNTAVVPEQPVGGTGLQPSPATALRENTDGYVDYVDGRGNKVGRGGATPPANAIFTRRWSIDRLPENPDHTLVLQVLVTRLRDRGAADAGGVARLPEGARLVTVRTRMAR
jgi:type II secretory pathway pseudopilin PulG